ncbi:MAG: FAD-dependent oxidoreductase [Anaerolineales bacterium]|nr:FAD-dependent oxidoreductase [Anaerolineales bacterium]
MKILVIGGGVIGVCSAYFLQKEGHSVTIVEQAEPGSGCSYGNAGLVVPGHAGPLARPGIISRGLRWLMNDQSPFFIKPRLDPALLAWLWNFWRNSNPQKALASARALNPLAQASRELTSQIIETESIDCDFRDRGMLQLFRSEEELLATAEEEQQYAIPGLEPQVLDNPQARELEPAIREEVAGALLHPRDGSFDPAAFVRGLADAFEREGGSVRPHTEALDFDVDGGQVRRVSTSRGEFAPDLTVISAGALTPHLGSRLGLKIPIQPAKGYSLTYRAPPAGPRVPLLLGEDWVAVTPMGDKLRFAGTLELVGHDPTINARRVSAVAAAPRRYLHLDNELTLLETWSGARPATAHGLPVIARPPGLTNVIIAAGHGMLGMTLGPATGSLVAALAARRDPEIDMQPFSLGRVK